MTSQQALFLDTILGMKKALKRKAYDSDSDSEIDKLTNRGKKLRKKARYVREGQLALPNGPRVYKREIEYAGRSQHIISQNPHLMDDDGYEIDPEDDDEIAREAIATAAELDPYADIKIEHLLAPLTVPSDLPDHPTLSIPFLSKTLSDLTRQAGEMVQKERATLAKIKHLLTRLSGDNTWIPCENVETDRDFDFFIDEPKGKKSFLGDEEDRMSAEAMRLEGVPQELVEDQSNSTSVPTELAEEPSTSYATTKTMESATNAKDSITTTLETNVGGGENQTSSATEKALPKAPETTDVEAMEVDGGADSAEGPVLEGDDSKEAFPDLENDEPQDDAPAPRRMRTRAQAQAASDENLTNRTRSPTPDSSIEPLIHPYFLAPKVSHPDRDLGLPQVEADETRRFLLLYIHKQEEVCRGAQRVYEGLLKADRHRHLVMKWAKADGHVGENRDMSDGEDWYDKDEWGLTEDLKKGQDEEEEPVESTKKTRNRRQ